MLNPQYPEILSHGLVIGTTGSLPSSSSSLSFLPSASSPGVRVSSSFFFIRCAFSLAGCFLPFFQSSKELLFSSLFLTKHVLRVAILFGPLAPIWLPRLLSHLSGSPTVPWLLVLRLLASAVLQLYRTSLPCLIVLRTIWSEWTRSRWSPWLAAGCLLSAQ